MFQSCGPNNNVIQRETGRSYSAHYSFASGLAGLMAIYPKHVIIEESLA